MCTTDNENVGLSPMILAHNPDLNGDGVPDNWPQREEHNASLLKCSLEDWQGERFYGDFDTEVWCVKCQLKSAICEEP